MEGECDAFADPGINEAFFSCTQLGFLEKRNNPLFLNSNWRAWDGGKVGGNPVWLNPMTIPSSESLECRHCKNPLMFLLQIYCPLDDNPSAFHRCLYVFCCRRRSCIAEKNVVCFRSQLPRKNSFYPYDPSTTICATESETQEDAPLLCALCGCRGTKKCGACGLRSYCSKFHQQKDWKMHRKECGLPVPVQASSIHDHKLQLEADGLLFPVFDIVVEAECVDENSSAAECHIDGAMDLTRAKAAADTVSTSGNTVVWDDAITEGGVDECEDAKLSQTDYNLAMGNREEYDPVYGSFLARIAKDGCAGQVLRYCRWPSPEVGGAIAPHKLPSDCLSHGALLLNGKSNTRDLWKQVPPCPRCGSSRRFEFQVCTVAPIT